MRKNEEINKILNENIRIEENKNKNKSKVAAVVDDYLRQIKIFEEDNIESLKKTNRFLWKLSSLACSVALLFALGMFFMFPLKTVVPYLVRVDNLTGEYDIVNPLEGVETYEDKLNKFWINSYVTLRESYLWATVGGVEEKIKLLSTSGVFKEYQSAFLGVNSPLNIFKEKYSIRVNIKGTTFFETKDKTLISQTRLTKTVVDNNGEIVELYPLTNWLVTSTFDYKKEIKREKEADVNPLGFEITSYNIDLIKE